VYRTERALTNVRPRYNPADMSDEARRFWFSSDVVAISTSYGPLRYGEGKYGCVEQVVAPLATTLRTRRTPFEQPYGPSVGTIIVGLVKLRMIAWKVPLKEGRSRLSFSRLNLLMSRMERRIAL
jgi:hypothetical protein